MHGYKTTARLLHWIVALAVIATIPVGQIMITEGLARSTQNALFLFHKNVGVILLFLIALRLLYRAFNPPPPLPDTVPDWQKTVSGLTHWGLYGLLILMTLSGYVRVEAGGFPIEMLDALSIGTPVPRSDALANTAKAIHFYGRYLMILLILMHVGAALLHGIVKRDGVFTRMWPPVQR